jgi:hypothetical protein
MRRFWQDCLVVLGLAALLPLSGCGADVVNVELTEEGAAGNTGVLDIPGLPSFGSSLSRALNKKDVNPKDVDSMKLRECSIKMLSQGGLSEDLSFMEKLEFWVSGGSLDRALMATQPSFPAGTRQADLQVTQDLELKPYLDTGGMVVEAEVPLVMPPPDLVEFELYFKIRVDVNVI